MKIPVQITVPEKKTHNIKPEQGVLQCVMSRTWGCKDTRFV
jgi:hypothetical protein